MSESEENNSLLDTRSRPCRTPRPRKRLHNTENVLPDKKSDNKRKNTNKTESESHRNSCIRYTDDEDTDENDFGHKSEAEYSDYDEIPWKNKEQMKSRKLTSFDKTDKNMAKSQNSLNLKYISCIILLVSISVSIYVILCTGEKNDNSPESVFENSMKDIRKKFREQNSDMWDEIIPSLKDVFHNYAKLSIITLFANETSTMDCLAKSLGNISSTVLGSNEYIELTPQNIGNDLGDIIIKLKKEIPYKRAVVVKDLLNISVPMLRAFHNLCDKENPLVSRAVLIMTMVINAPEKLKNHKALNFIENQLKRIASDKIEKDTLDPLITRITSGVILQVQPERNLRHCLYS